jgi:cell division protein FtsL
MAAHARVRTRPSTQHARRVSGPVRRPVPVVGPPLRRGSTGVFERIRALPETRVIDGLLRGRAWIWLIGILLGGIVAMQVSLLKLNAGISRAVTTAGTLERQNADLESQIAELSTIERVRDAAQSEDMVAPAPGAMD